MKKMFYIKSIILSLMMVFMITHTTYGATATTTYPRIAVQDGEWIYYIDDIEHGSLYKSNLDLGNATKVADMNTEAIIIKNNWVYYLEDPYSIEGNTQLCRIMTDGTNKQILRNSDNFRGMHSLTYHNDLIYFVSDFKLKSMSPDGSNETYVCDYSDNRPFQIDGRYLYSIKYDGSINRVDMFTNEKDFIDYGYNVESFALHKGQIYCATEYDRDVRLFKQNLQTKEITNISGDYTKFDSLFIEGDYLYLQADTVNDYKDTILRMTLEDNIFEVISNTRFYDFTIAGDHIFSKIENRMVKLDTINKKSTLLSEDELINLVAVVMPNQGVYYSNRDGIFLVKLDGSKTQVTTKQAKYLKVYEHYLLYKSQYDDKRICVYNTLTNVETCIDGSDDYWPLEIEDNTLFICDSGSVNIDDAYLYELPLSATDVSNLTKVTPFLHYGKIKNGILYKEWFAGHNAYGALLSVDLTTDLQKELFKKDLLDYDITDNTIYYAGSRSSSRGIYACSLNGSNKRTLYTSNASSNPGFFEIYGDYLYFEERNKENMHYSIKRINLNNNQTEFLFSDSADFIGMIDNYLIYQPHKRNCTLPINADTTEKIRLVEELKYITE